MQGIRKLGKRDWYLIGGLTVLAALVRFVRLKHPSVIVFDETYFANFAHDYLTHTKFFDAEPPLAKFLIAGGEWLFGFNSFGWRVAPALFGTAVIPLSYIFAKRLFGGIRIPLLAGLIALLDGLYLVESRTAVIDMFAVWFNLLTYTFFLCSLQARHRGRSFLWLGLTGISFGLALAVKWITLAFLGPAVALLVVLAFAKRNWLKRFFRVRSAAELFGLIGAKPENLQRWYTYLLLLGVLPFAIYVFIFSFHVPFDSTGEGIWGIHKQIYHYHHTLTATHPYGSKWYTWPLELRPVAYYFNADTGRWAGIVALGNPLLWWGGLLALGYALWRFVRTRSLVLGFILFAFIAHFGPWSLISRVLFLYHYLGALPFVFLALAYALGDSWQWRPKDPSFQLFTWILLVAGAGTIGGLLGASALGTTAIGFPVGAALVAVPVSAFALLDVRRLCWGQKQVIVFVGLAALAFIYFYPVWTGVGLSSADYYRHMWLRSWL